MCFNADRQPASSSSAAPGSPPNGSAAPVDKVASASDSRDAIRFGLPASSACCARSASQTICASRLPSGASNARISSIRARSGSSASSRRCCSRVSRPGAPETVRSTNCTGPEPQSHWRAATSQQRPAPTSSRSPYPARKRGCWSQISQSICSPPHRMMSHRLSPFKNAHRSPFSRKCGGSPTMFCRSRSPNAPGTARYFSSASRSTSISQPMQQLSWHAPPMQRN